jgi:hypothetical protein
VRIGHHPPDSTLFIDFGENSRQRARPGDRENQSTGSLDE